MPDIYIAKKEEKGKTQSQAKEEPIKEPVVTAAESKQETKKEEKDVKKKVIEEVTTNPLAAFMSKPRNLRFETQEQKEKVILLLRRHLITNVPWLVATTAMAIFPFLAVRIFPLDFIPPSYRLIIFITWYLLTFAFSFEKFLSWFFNVNIITDERIVDVDFPSILYRDISTTKIDQIQDVSIKVGGFVRSLFNYGDVAIQTAGTVPEICFEAVPRPGRVAKILNDLILEEEQEKIDGRVR